MQCLGCMCGFAHVAFFLQRTEADGKCQSAVWLQACDALVMSVVNADEFGINQCLHSQTLCRSIMTVSFGVYSEAEGCTGNMCSF